MTNSLTAWLAFAVLVSVIGLTSCQAAFGAVPLP